MNTRRLVVCFAVVVAACSAPSGGGAVSDSSATKPAASSPGSPGRPVVAPRPSPTPRSTTTAEIETLTTRIAASPNDAAAHRDLGFAYLQRARETADPTDYARAEAAIARARDLASDDVLVLIATGSLQLSRHEFEAALATGEAALATAPGLGAAQGIVVDALVELGRYEEAAVLVDRMLATSRDIASLSRASYLLEIHGDLEGAVAAMREAAAAPALAPENTAYVTAVLGNLLVYAGDVAGARRAYGEALALVPGHAPSIAGLGRLATGDGDLAQAAVHFERAATILPLPEYVVALGESLEAAGNPAAARRWYALARAESELLRANGVVVDLELALFEADHGDPGLAVELARAAYRATPTIRAADALAWALHRSGRTPEAVALSTEALRLGTLDPVLRFHAGAIAAALGDREAASSAIETALALDPGFSPTAVAEARRILEAGA